MRDLPPRARAYVAAVVALAATAVGFSAVTFDGSWLDVVTFFALFAMASAYATHGGRGVSFSVGFIVGLAAVVVVGWAGAALISVGGAFIRAPGSHFTFTKRVFNGAQLPLSALAAGLMFDAWAPAGDAFTTVPMWRLLVGTVAACLVYYLVNISLVSGVVSLSSGLSPGRVWKGSISPVAVVYLGYGLLGVTMASLYEDMGPLSAVFFLVPLLVARSAFANYSQQREAYDSTVRAFAQAVETKDYYTRGHSERVAKVTELIAREWGMREDRVQVIRIAGMLHDVGKLGVPTRVLQKQGKLNQLEFEAIKLHPLRGYEMLCEIEFLREALDGVYHHHERLDGRGYPMGLTDQEIPEFARIIMVADAFDSMTSTRSYRQAKPVDEAIAELRRCQGVQFDPKVVDCLVAGIEKHGWEPNPEEFHGERVTREGSPIEQAAVAADD